jgi:hypothetical protein
MRLEFATMALGLAVFTRSIQNRSVSAFNVNINNVRTRTFTTSSFSKLNLSAVVENDTDDIDMSTLFPQMGKDIEDVAPRMRFAPSPTGR